MGKTGNKYEIKEEVAKGACSILYRGICLETKNEVAIKLTKHEVLDEYKILKRVRKLNNAHLIKVIDYNTHYLIFPYYRQTLYDYLMKHGPLSVPVIFRIILQIVKAVRILHDNNIVHLDLKLENIMLDDNDNIIIIDFNLSEIVKPNVLITKLCCSQHYIAPEVLHGLPFDPFKVDVWTLGILLYCLWTRYFPFDHIHKYKIADLIINKEITYPKSMPTQIVSLLKNMLDKNYVTRYDLYTLENHLLFINYYSTIG